MHYCLRQFKLSPNKGILPPFVFIIVSTTLQPIHCFALLRCILLSVTFRRVSPSIDQTICNVDFMFWPIHSAAFLRCIQGGNSVLHCSISLRNSSVHYSVILDFSFHQNTLLSSFRFCIHHCTYFIGSIQKSLMYIITSLQGKIYDKAEKVFMRCILSPRNSLD